jgi:hypothetical protein
MRSRAILKKTVTRPGLTQVMSLLLARLTAGEMPEMLLAGKPRRIG